MTLDVIAIIVAAIVTALVCATFVARTRHEPTTPRSVLALGLAAGVCAVIAFLAVHLVAVAGQGDPLGTVGDLASTAVENLVRPLAVIVAVVAANVGFVVGGLQLRPSQGPTE